MVACGLTGDDMEAYPQVIKRRFSNFDEPGTGWRVSASSRPAETSNRRWTDFTRMRASCKMRGPYNASVIIGSTGSGKSTLGKGACGKLRLPH